MPLGDTKSYNPLNSLFIFYGFPIQDFAEGTWLNFTFPNQLWNSVVGADGVNFRTLNLQGFSGQCEVTLKQGSESNQIMQAVLDADIATNAPGALLFKDKDSLTTILGSKCYIDRFAPASRDASNQTNVVWTIYIPRVISNLAGYKS